MNTFANVLPAAVNHLLAQESWAREKLRAHAGKVARIDAGVVNLKWKVAADGMLQAAMADDAENVVVRVQPADLPRILQDRSRAVSYVKVEGDADFAHTISHLSQNLKWEAEEDLSKLVGDIAATRLVSGAKGLAGAIKSTHQAIMENMAEYLVEENPVLVRPVELDDFARDVVKLRDDVERLEKRIQKI